MNDLRIVFMGTPEFAVPSLEAIITAGYKVAGVVTAPDKPQGRGLKPTPSAVKKCASEHGLNILQPEKLKSPVFLESLKALNANLQVVVAFRMLPEQVWSMPAFGTFNLHASLLPQYRGAAPINWAIINGEKETGVTTFFLKHEIDTGSVIFQEREPISDDDTAGTLYQRLMKKGAGLVLKTIRAIESGSCPSIRQQEYAGLNHAPKIFREMCEVRWDQPATDIRNFVRGLNPTPSAWATIEGRIFKIFQVTVVPDSGGAEPGSIATDNSNYLRIAAADGWVSVDELQAEGKKRMTIAEFFRGNKILHNHVG